MSQYYCHRCEETLELDREITYTRGGLTNMAIWCHKDPVLNLKCFSEESLEMMIAIKKSGEKCHLVNWDYSKDCIKIPEHDSLMEDQEQNGGAINSFMAIGFLTIFPIIVIGTVNFLCNYLSGVIDK